MSNVCMEQRFLFVVNFLKLRIGLVNKWGTLLAFGERTGRLVFLLWCSARVMCRMIYALISRDIFTRFQVDEI